MPPNSARLHGHFHFLLKIFFSNDDALLMSLAFVLVVDLEKCKSANPLTNAVTRTSAKINDCSDLILENIFICKVFYSKLLCVIK